MDQDSTDNPKAPAPRTTPRGSGPAVAADLPPQTRATDDIDPAMTALDEDDEALLPEVTEEAIETVAEGPLAAGHAAIENAVKLARGWCMATAKVTPSLVEEMEYGQPRNSL